MQSSAPRLALPVECQVGKSCLIQKLVDHDTGTGRRDYKCGTLTTDGHDGVDIRLRTMSDMREGFAVTASAAGTVMRARDGEPDDSARKAINTNGKDAGNGVVIDHGNGWETQYSHLKLGSIGVRPGQAVITGQRLGLIGLSGNTEYPHLHFTVRFNGTALDPFTGTGQSSLCSERDAPAGLWAADTARKLAYTPTAIVSVGLESSVPPRSVVNRTGIQAHLERNAPILLWADVMGAKIGDVQVFNIVGPDGRSVHSQRVVVADGGLSWFAYSGKRAPASGWPTGQYVGQYLIERSGRNISKSDISTMVE